MLRLLIQNKFIADPLTVVYFSLHVLGRMESWYYELSAIKNSPSSKDGINFELETRYRSEGSKFISTIGGQLKLYPLI